MCWLAATASDEDVHKSLPNRDRSVCLGGQPIPVDRKSIRSRRENGNSPTAVADGDWASFKGENHMTYNINNAANLNVFADIEFEMGFDPIKSVSDLDTAIAAGSLFEKFQNASAGHRDRLTYLDIAQVVHAIREIEADQAMVAEAKKRCKEQNVTFWREDIDAAKDKPANIYKQYVMLLRGDVSVNGTDKTTELSASWKNNLRVVRYLVETKLPSGKLVDYIETATETVGTGTLTKLEALRAKDTAKHPSTTKTAKTFSQTKAYDSAVKAASIASVSGLDAHGKSYENFRVLLVRDGDNDNHEVVGVVNDAELVKKVLRTKFAK
jgi:hypothetical protein